MAQVTKNTSDTEDWSKGNGEFYVASKSTVTNRRAKTYNYSGGSDSESKQLNRQQYQVYRSENDVPYLPNPTSNSTAIHVDVRSPYPPVEIPIRRISTTGQNWATTNEQQQRTYVNPSETLLVSPPTARNQRGSTRTRRTIRQDSETRVISKMTIPPLESPGIGRPRNQQRSYSTDLIRESQVTSQQYQQQQQQQRKQYQEATLNNTFRQMNVREAPNSRSQTPGRQKKDHRRHHYHCCGHNHSRSRADSLSGPRDRYASLRQVPMAYGLSPGTPIALCPGCSPHLHYPEEYPANYATAAPYLASPAIPIHYTLPRGFAMPGGFSPRSAAMPMSTIPSMTPGSVRGYGTAYRRPSRATGQYHCVCCPNGQHQIGNSSKVFNFDSDQWESDGHPPLGFSNVTKRTTTRQQQQRMQANGMYKESSRLSRQTPTEFDIPIREEGMDSATLRRVPQNMASPGSVLNESTFMSQKMQHATWNSALSPKGPGMGLLHGEVTRDDGFPADYIDLIDGGVKNASGGEDGSEEGTALVSPDKKVVVQLAEMALNSATAAPQVATTLKKAMDDNFGPVWHVVAGTGAYGSNIASLGGQLLHFKAFGWAFLIWKTSDQQPE